MQKAPVVIDPQGYMWSLSNSEQQMASSVIKQAMSEYDFFSGCDGASGMQAMIRESLKMHQERMFPFSVFPSMNPSSFISIVFAPYIFSQLLIESHLSFLLFSRSLSLLFPVLLLLSCPPPPSKSDLIANSPRHILFIVFAGSANPRPRVVPPTIITQEPMAKADQPSGELNPFDLSSTLQVLFLSQIQCVVWSSVFSIQKYDSSMIHL
jgi:hypothetical protein